jgi:tetratricopeptide (TPR) repeat protein
VTPLSPAEPPVVLARSRRPDSCAARAAHSRASTTSPAPRKPFAGLSLTRAAGSQRHPTVAVTLDELGGLYFRQGRFADATRDFTQSISPSRQLYRDGHVAIARSLNNLANTHATLRRYRETEQIYREAPDSGELATSLSNLDVAQ